MNHFATPGFWFQYRHITPEVRALADKNFALLKADPRHPSLRFKKIGALWTVRVGLAHRAIARERGEGFVWVWIGHHSVYDRILRGR